MAKGYRHYIETINENRPLPGARQEKIDEWATACLVAYSRFQVLCAIRAGPWGVEGMNRKIRAWLRERLKIEGDAEWFEGRPVMVTRNDYRTGLMNGDVGLCMNAPTRDGEQLRVFFRKEDGKPQSFHPSRIMTCETAWAITVHKAQGSEYDHAMLVVPEHISQVLSRELIYTALTRARKHFTLVASDPDIFTAGVGQKTRRYSGLSLHLNKGHDAPVKHHAR